MSNNSMHADGDSADASSPPVMHDVICRNRKTAKRRRRDSANVANREECAGRPGRLAASLTRNPGPVIKAERNEANYRGRFGKESTRSPRAYREREESSKISRHHCPRKEE